MSDQDFTGDGIGLAGERGGQGRAVVGLHGLTATRRYVVMGSRSLQRSGHDVILLDARGHGASDPAPASDGYGYERQLADVACVLERLDVGPAVIAGASMGAHTGLALALAHPSRVCGLVLVTPAHDPGVQEDAARLARWDALANGLERGGVEGFLDAYGPPAVPEALRATVVRGLRQRLARHLHPEAVARALREVPRSAPFETWAELSALRVRCHVVASRDETDPEHPEALARRYAAVIPGARLHIEAPGASPLAWRGAWLSALIAEVVTAT